MPVVTRADCTQIDVEEHYKFLKDPDPVVGISGVIEEMSVRFVPCQGAEDHNNDLAAFFQQLVDDEKVGADEQEVFASRVVGNGQCHTKRDELLAASGYTGGYYIDESKWEYIVGKCTICEVGGVRGKAMDQDQDQDQDPCPLTSCTCGVD